MSVNSTLASSQATIQTVDPLLKYSWFPQSKNYYALHLHEIVYAFLFYQFISSYIAPMINAFIFRERYTSIKDKKLKIDFDIHVVSMVQAFVSLYIIWPVLTLPLFTYNIATYQNDYCSMITALSSGYFVWDLIVCLKYIHIYGFQFLIHAIVALYGSLVPLMPVVQVWVPKFLVYEASTPFVNINWFIMQLTTPPSSSTLKPVKVPLWFNALNGVCLMAVFFIVRIVWGNLAQFMFFYQMFKYRHEMSTLKATLSFVLALVTLVLNMLNFFWFDKMLKIAKKLASPSNKNKKKD
ncbi:hypothetical protein MOUN0_E02674 [Monosporozyma unispora]|nr:hypothetical protein C6P44_003696 [Kazachstania unispora]